MVVPCVTVIQEKEERGHDIREKMAALGGTNRNIFNWTDKVNLVSNT